MLEAPAVVVRSAPGVGAARIMAAAGWNQSEAFKCNPTLTHALPLLSPLRPCESSVSTPWATQVQVGRDVFFVDTK